MGIYIIFHNWPYETSKTTTTPVLASGPMYIVPRPRIKKAYIFVLHIFSFGRSLGCPPGTGTTNPTAPTHFGNYLGWCGLGCPLVTGSPKTDVNTTSEQGLGCFSFT